MDPVVSIGIPTYNRANMVCEAIWSVLKQTYQKVEVVVVDDGSKDDTQLKLGVFSMEFQSEAYPRVRLITLPTNRGIAVAKNIALRGGVGTYRGILDSDDLYAPSFVERCVEELEKSPEIGLVYTDNVQVDEFGALIQPTPALDWSLEQFLKTRNLRGDSWLARWEILEKTPLHDERFLLDVDYDLFYQLAPLTKFKRIPSFLHCWRIHGGQTSTTDRRFTAAYWHAAGLGKYGYPIEHALTRATEHGKANEWRQSIVDGYAYGTRIRESDWEQAVKKMAVRRTELKDYQKTYYEEINGKAAAFLDIGGKTLDVGCGDGSGRTFKSTITDYTGIDVHLPNSAPDLIEASAESIPFEDASFDSVLMHSVLQHVMNPEKALQEVQRVLKPGGRFGSLTCVDDPNPIFCWFWNRDQLMALIGKYFVVRNLDVFDRRHCVINARKA